jgi:hypothetical protein
VVTRCSSIGVALLAQAASAIGFAATCSPVMPNRRSRFENQSSARSSSAASKSGHSVSQK